jgi:hypothetical protein
LNPQETIFAATSAHDIAHEGPYGCPSHPKRRCHCGVAIFGGENAAKDKTHRFNVQRCLKSIRDMAGDFLLDVDWVFA